MAALKDELLVLMKEHEKQSMEMAGLTVQQKRLMQKMKLLLNPVKLGHGRKICPGCHAIVGAPTKVCKACEHRFLPRKVAVENAVTGRLKKKRAQIGELVDAAFECHVVTSGEIRKLLKSLVERGLVTRRGKEFIWKRKRRKK